MLRFHLVVFLLLGSFALTLAKVNVHEVHCNANSSVCKQWYCVVTKTRGTNNYLNAGCYFLQPIKPLILHLRMYRRVKQKYEPFNVDVHYNLCDIYKSIAGNPIANYMISNSVKYVSNLRCPLTGNVTLNRMPMILFFAQAVLPNAEYLIDGYVYNNDGFIMSTNLTFGVNQWRS